MKSLRTVNSAPAVLGLKSWGLYSPNHKVDVHVEIRQRWWV